MVYTIERTEEEGSVQYPILSYPILQHTKLQGLS